jgi:hypothetical protein
VTVSIAGIGPLANLGTEDRNKTAEAPDGGIIWVEHFERLEYEELLTKCCLESVCCVLADAIPAVQIEGTDTTRTMMRGAARLEWSNLDTTAIRTQLLQRWMGWNACGHILSRLQ